VAHNPVICRQHVSLCQIIQSSSPLQIHELMCRASCSDHLSIAFKVAAILGCRPGSTRSPVAEREHEVPYTVAEPRTVAIDT